MRNSVNNQALLSYILPILSGILIALAFPKIELYLLAWIGLIPLLFSIIGRTPSIAFKQGFVFGIFYFFGTIWWISHSINHYGGINQFVSLLLVFLLSSYLSLYTAIFTYLTSYYIEKTHLPFIFISPALWVSLEYIRTYLFTGFPWSVLGYSQYKFSTIIQISDITGVYGVSFLIVAVNCIATDIYLLKKRQKEKPLLSVVPTYAGYVFLGSALIFTMCYGVYRLNQNRDFKFVRISVIQGNIEQAQKWDNNYQRYVMDVHKDLSQRAKNTSPQLIIWPETSLPFVYETDNTKTAEINNLAQELQTYLLIGAMMQKRITKDKVTETFYTNSAMLLDASGRLSYRYDKIHLVPFGEYVPLKQVLFFVDKLAYTAGEYLPGDGFVKALTPFGLFSTLICYEIIFPGLTRKFFQKGGDFIVNITNDAWFGDTPGPYQHFSIAVFRAVENRKSIVRSANTGISGYIDSNGRIIDKSNIFVRQYLTQNLPIDRTNTIYTKYGDIFSYFCILMSLFLVTKKVKSR